MGCQDTKFNHHVGRVLALQGRDGRVGVALHGAIWPRRVGRHGSIEHRPIACKPENLRRVRLSEPSRATSLLGSVSLELVVRLFGEAGRGLPGNVAELIADNLRIRHVSPEDVSVTGCSSSRGDFPLGAALSDPENEWWISEPRSMPGGVGCEHLEFSFGEKPRRISFVAVKIPPLPHGPLSVRQFHLLALQGAPVDSSVSACRWVLAAGTPLETLDRGDLQEFALVPPVETRGLRLVCTLAAASVADCVGLFQVRFA